MNLLALTITCCILATSAWASGPRVRAVVFDCDGVLVDSEGAKFAAWRDVLKSAHVELTRGEYLGVVGLDNRAILNRIAERHHAQLPETLIAAKERRYRDLQRGGVRLIAPAVEFVRHLARHRRELNVKLALASSAVRTEIMENLRQAKLTDAFDEIVSGVDDLRDVRDPAGVNKPAPYIYREVARRLRVSAADMLVFEDSAAGVLAARRAGARVVAVPNDYTQTQDFDTPERIDGFGKDPTVVIRRFGLEGADGQVEAK